MTTFEFEQGNFLTFTRDYVLELRKFQLCLNKFGLDLDKALKSKRNFEVRHTRILKEL